MNIAFLGSGAWGTALGSLLCGNGHRTMLWSQDAELAHLINTTHQHPKLPGLEIHPALRASCDLAEVMASAEVICEAVTSAGIRPVCEELKQLGVAPMPLIMTSKGIEQHTGLLLPEVAIDVLGEEWRDWIGLLSGPSYAEEVLRRIPTVVVAAAYGEAQRQRIVQLFSSPLFRVYPNADLKGVGFGGAMKNIIAIAAGTSDGLGFGMNTKAALMTRGLHEMRKLAAANGALPDTLNGLSGMGDLMLTCFSPLSRNYRFGGLLAEGLSPQEAKERIGMAVEGAYTCLSAYELARKSHVAVPVIDTVYDLLEHGMPPQEAVERLMARTIKEETL